MTVVCVKGYNQLTRANKSTVKKCTVSCLFTFDDLTWHLTHVSKQTADFKFLVNSWSFSLVFFFPLSHIMTLCGIILKKAILWAKGPFLALVILNMVALKCNLCSMWDYLLAHWAVHSRKFCRLRAHGSFAVKWNWKLISPDIIMLQKSTLHGWKVEVLSFSTKYITFL